MRKLLIVFLAFLSFSASAQVAGSKQIVTQTLTELKTKLGFKGQYVQLLGNSSINDGGQRMYAWDSISTQANDDVTCVQVTGVTTGRWKLVVNDQVYRASWWGLQSGGGDQAAKLNAMFMAVPLGSTIVFDYDKTYYTSSKVIIPQSLTIIGNQSSITYSGAATVVLSIQASNVTIDGLEVNATYTTFTTSSGLIESEGSSNTSFYTNIVIKNCILHDFIDCGIRLRYVRDFKIQNNKIYQLPYGGIIVFSGISGLIENNDIKDITGLGTPTDASSGRNNAYGIEVLRQVSITTDSLPRDVTIRKNKVRNIQWEGIDTHGGQQLKIYDNEVYDCTVGIAMVALTGTTQKDIVIEANVVDNNGIKTDDGNAAIQIEGLSAGPVYATGIVIQGNICRWSGIKLQYTRGIVVANNIIKYPYNSFGVQIDRPNYALTISGNVFTDVMHTSNNTAAISNSWGSSTPGYNEINIYGNSLVDEGSTPPTGGYRNRYFYRCNTDVHTTDVVKIFDQGSITSTFLAENDSYTRYMGREGQGTFRVSTSSVYAITPTVKYVIYDYSAGGTSMTLPALNATNNGREIIIANRSSGIITLSASVYTNNTTSTTTVAAGEVVRLLYDNAAGKIWKF